MSTSTLSHHATTMLLLIPKNPPITPPDLPNKADQSLSLLFTLPAELRNIIYSYLLIQKPDGAHAPTHSDHDPRRAARFCAAILRTCKQAHAEGTPMLYGDNIFHAHPSLLASLPSFLLALVPMRLTMPPVTHAGAARRIRRFYLFVRLDVDARFSAAQAEEAFSGIEELDVDVFQAMYGSCDFGVLGVLEGVRGVGKAGVRGSTGDGRYAEWLARRMELPVGEEGVAYVGEKAWDAWVEGNR